MNIATLIYLLLGIIGVAIEVWCCVTYNQEHKNDKDHKS